ncbi:hypothetical protein [Pseudoduganella sp. OTU4001]|uniref:hypothetical protein n=1 Tax=Pseudoduganella sp. OTU4001 TaxID=3043854 RepID=UPI00313ED8D2
MTAQEEGIGRMIKKGLSTNDRNSPEDVLEWAICLGRDLGVTESRVKEIFRDIREGKITF